MHRRILRHGHHSAAWERVAVHRHTARRNDPEALDRAEERHAPRLPEDGVEVRHVLEGCPLDVFGPGEGPADEVAQLEVLLPVCAHAVCPQRQGQAYSLAAGYDEAREIEADLGLGQEVSVLVVLQDVVHEVFVVLLHA